MTPYQRYHVAYRLALLEHYRAAIGTTTGAARALGMARPNFLRALCRLRAQAARIPPRV
jgi:hypothetical protein